MYNIICKINIYKIIYIKMFKIYRENIRKGIGIDYTLYVAYIKILLHYYYFH